MKNIHDDRGFNQIWADTKSTRVRASRRCDYMISQMSPAPGKSVLEIGCGTGANSHMLASRTGMQILGTDLCEPFIAEAKRSCTMANLRFEVRDFNLTDGFQGDRFDYIVGNGILHHLYLNLDSALAKIRMLLKPRGRIIFLEPNLLNPYIYCIFSFPMLRKVACLEPTEMAFSKSFAVGKLIEAGFVDIKVEYKDFLLPGVPEWLITPLVVCGDFLEKTPARLWSQSLGIRAEASLG